MVDTETEIRSAELPSPRPTTQFAPGAKLDSVYFFMWPGWRDELESNRWHWSKRWAQRLPVVLIQPELPVGEPARAVPEHRLANVELLSVEKQSDDARDWLASGLRQAGQIAAHMAFRGHRHPVFWFYNPHLVAPYALLPARARVFHATENYFHFRGLNDDWLNYYRYAIEAGDLAICCSSGVADALIKHTRQRKLLTLPNGCDFFKYARPTAAPGDWPAQIADWQQPARRLAVYAGNINYRIDFDLIEALVAHHPEIGFVFAGPLDFYNLSDGQRSAWVRLQRRSNFRTLGRIPAEDIPALYWRCDVGIIPYRFDLPIVVENGFPLKALEMAAAGLPVVASLMKPLREIAGAVTVVADAEAFCAALATHSRCSRGEAERNAAEQICRAYDYDILFERMAQALEPLISDACRPADLAGLAERIGLDSYMEALTRLAHIPSTGPVRPPRVPFRCRVGALLLRIPPEIRLALPEPIRRVSRRWFL